MSRVCVVYPIFTVEAPQIFEKPRVTYLRRSHEQHPDAEGSGCLAHLACDISASAWLWEIPEKKLTRLAPENRGVYVIC